MKIVQINDACGTNSIGRTTSEFADYLKQQGHDSYVFYSIESMSYSNSIQIGNRAFQIVHALLSRITGLQGYFSYIPTYKLLKRLNKIQPDIVHVRNLHSNYINLGMLFRYLAKNDIATVLTLHDCWLYTGKCTYYVSASCEKWKDSCGNCPLLHIDNVNPTFWFDRSKKCLADKKKWLQSIPRLATVGVSQWVTNEAKYSILQNSHLYSIYNWIDSAVFSPRNIQHLKEKLSLQNKMVVLMVTTFISENKGYQVLTELSSLLDNRDYQLILVGKNKDNFYIPSNVIHISHTNDANELAEYYSLADVCVNTTKFETFGKVTAEALCCGTPVIVYNNTASPELMGEGCGYVVEPEQGIQAIIEAIQEIEKNTKQAYSDNCVAFAKQKFNKENGITQYIKVYESLLKT